jgi:L-lysine 6-transaminase
MPFPGKKSKPLAEKMQKLGVMETRPFVIDLERCDGMYLCTIDNQFIFDWAGYYGSRLLGHNHPCFSNLGYQHRILVAAQNKIANPDFVTKELVQYYKFLHNVAPKCMRSAWLKTYTVNSGAEAVENALKYCVSKYKATHSDVDPPRFICFEGGFHGRTVYALSHTDMPYDPEATRDFRDLVVSPIRLPFPENSKEAIKASLAQIKVILDNPSNNIAGILVEPMQSAGGNRIVDKSWFQGLSRLTNWRGISLIFDEVQTAGGQTGTMWMCDQFDLPYSPTCIVTAKKFGCGVVYMENGMDNEVLDSTWSGTLVDMVRVPYEFETVKRENLIKKVPAKAKLLTEGLQKLAKRYPDIIKKVQGVGLYQGFEVSLPDIKAEIIKRMLYEEHTLVLSSGLNYIRLRPNLNVTKKDIKLLLEKLERVLIRTLHSKIGFE